MCSNAISFYCACAVDKGFNIQFSTWSWIPPELNFIQALERQKASNTAHPTVGGYGSSLTR